MISISDFKDTPLSDVVEYLRNGTREFQSNTTHAVNGVKSNDLE